MINALFVCGCNKLPSPCAARVLAAWPNVETDSAGLNPDARTLLGADQIVWADIISVMEPRQRTKLAKQFRRDLAGKRVICLDIPDRYAFMQPE